MTSLRYFNLSSWVNCWGSTGPSGIDSTFLSKRERTGLMIERGWTYVKARGDSGRARVSQTDAYAEFADHRYKWVA